MRYLIFLPVIIFAISLSVYSQECFVEITYNAKGEVDFTFSDYARDYISDYKFINIEIRNLRGNIIYYEKVRLELRQEDYFKTMKLNKGFYKIFVYDDNKKILADSEQFEVK